MTGGDVLSVLRHELRQMLYTPLSAVFQTGFLLALGAGVFLVAEFYSTDEASPRLLGVFLPWVALIFVPALSMRMWPNEQSDRSVELTATLPLETSSLVVGKFLACFCVLLATLAFTTPFVATVAYLGDPDPGVMLSMYIGMAAILAVFLAVSLFAAAWVREPIGAFVVGLAILFLLVLLGWDVFARTLEGTLPLHILNVLSLYSPVTWLMQMGQGRIDFGAGFYVLATVGVFLWLTERLVASRRKQGRRFGTIAPALGGLLVVILLIPFAAKVTAQIDMTEAQEFSLDDGTRQVLQQLPDGTKVTLYWSVSEASVPAPIKSHARRVEALLHAMASESDGRLTVQEVDPVVDSDVELEATGAGLRRVPMSSGDQFFLGLTVSDGQRQGTIPYLDVRRDRLAEYDIAVALNGLTQDSTTKVGLLSPLIPASALDQGRAGMSFISELKQAYDLAVIPHFATSLPEDLDVLIVIGATILRKDMLYAIDQFVMKGGGLIVMMDPYLRFDKASNQLSPDATEDINDITDLLARYGARFIADQVVGDPDAASLVADTNEQRLSYPFWMRLREQGLSPDHPVSAALNEVFFVESGAFEITDSDHVQPLVTSGPASGTLNKGDFASSQPRELTLALQPEGGARPLAVAISGLTTSAFEAAPANGEDQTYTATANGKAKVIAVADVDWVFDPFSLQTTNVDGRSVIRPLNDNLALLLNMVSFVSGDDALIGIRSRGQLQRPFTRVQALFQEAEAASRKQEAKLLARATEIETRIQSTLVESGATDLDSLPQDVKDEVVAYRDDLVQAQRDLRELRRLSRKDVDALGQRLTIANLLSGPLFVWLFWLAARLWRRHRARSFSSAL